MNSNLTEIQCPIASAAEKYGSEPALIDSDHTVTFDELNVRVASAALHLVRSGVKRGDRVAVLLEKSVEYIVTVWAGIRLGAVMCPLSSRLPSLALREQISQINASCIVTDTKGQSDLSDTIPGTISVSELSNQTAPDRTTMDAVRLDRPATILFTSGSTGQPKAVLHTLGSHYFSAVGANENVPFGPGDRWLLSLPLYHVGGLAVLFRAALGGGAVVLPKAQVEQDQNIVDQSITHLSLVPTQLYRLLKDRRSRSGLPSQLQAILLGGGPLPDHMMQKAVSSGWPVCATYGLTEMASQVTTARPGDQALRPFNSGRLLNHRELKISDEDEILVRGETLFAGYIDSTQIDLPVDNDGWFATGDCGYLDSDGNLVTTGRKDNMFISGGENIHPEEIEQALCNQPDVVDAVVVPVDSEEFGARPVAFVLTRSGEEIDRQKILSGLAEVVPRFKLPDRIFPWPEEYEQENLKPARVWFGELATRMIGAS